MRTGLTKRRGRRIAWRIIHPDAMRHAPLLVCCNGLGVPAEYWNAIAEQLGARVPVLDFDYAGQGDSDPFDPPFAFSFADFAADARAVMQDVGARDVILLGHSAGFQIALTVAATTRLPQRVHGLVSVLGSFPHPLRHVLDAERDPWWADAWYVASIFAPRALTLIWRALAGNRISLRAAETLGVITERGVITNVLDAYVANLVQMDARYAGALLQAAEHHPTPNLRRVVGRVPVLALAGTQDAFVPLAVATAWAKRLRATLITLDGASHAALMESPEEIAAHIRKWLVQNYNTNTAR